MTITSKTYFTYALLGFSLLVFLSSCEPTKKKSSDNSISSFVFEKSENKSLAGTVTATINKTDKTIKAFVSDSVSTTALVPTITLGDENATVSPMNKKAQNFTSEVSYTVAAEDGSKQKYTVSVKKLMIESFVFEKSENKKNLADAGNITATINEVDKTIKATVSGTTTVTALIPTIKLNDESITVKPASGKSQNFTSAITYTLSAKNGESDTVSKTYTVTVATSTTATSTTATSTKTTK